MGLLTKRADTTAGYWPSFFFFFLFLRETRMRKKKRKKNQANIQPS